MCSGVGMKLKLKVWEGEKDLSKILTSKKRKKRKVFCSGCVSGTYILKVMYNFVKRVWGGGGSPPPLPTPSYDVCVCGEVCVSVCVCVCKFPCWELLLKDYGYWTMHGGLIIYDSTVYMNVKITTHKLAYFNKIAIF